MSEHEAEQLEGVEVETGVEAEPVDEGTLAEAEAKHAEFLQTYQPVITRLPQALADERAEQTAAEEAAAAAEAQAQAERDEITRRQVEAQAQAEEEKRAYAEEHYPAS